MSKLDKLIEKLCLNDVEYKLLKNIVTEINIGINPRKFFKLNPEDSTGFYVTVRELNGLQGVKKYDKTDLINDDACRIINERAHIEKGDILFSNTGTVGKLALVDEMPNNWGVNEGIYVIKPDNKIILSKYLYYYLDSNHAYKDYSAKFTGSTLKHVTQKALESIMIAVPPLEVQCKIVHILDNFTVLSAELSAELKARQKQFDYYRDELLKFKDNVKNIKFGDIALIQRGASPRPIKDFITENKDGVNWIKIGDVEVDAKYITSTKEKITPEGAKKSRFVKKGDFILSNSMSFGRPYILAIDGCIHDGWLSISQFDSYYNTDFLYHLINSRNIQNEMRKRASFGGAVQNLNADIVKSIELPLPSLDVQIKIANILDKFEKLCNDISEGLPAEIEARQKQYEYYRDKLLNFKEL